MEPIKELLKSARWKMYIEDYPGAIEDYSKVIEFTPDDPEVYFSRGFALVMTGQKEEACIDFGKAKKLGHDRADKIILKYCKKL